MHKLFVVGIIMLAMFLPAGFFMALYSYFNGTEIIDRHEIRIYASIWMILTVIFLFVGAVIKRREPLKNY